MSAIPVSVRGAEAESGWARALTLERRQVRIDIAESELLPGVLLRTLSVVR